MVVSDQNKLQRLSLVSTSLLVAQMLLGAKGLPSLLLTVEKRRALTFCAASRYSAEVKETSARLLAQPDMRMPHLSARE